MFSDYKSDLNPAHEVVDALTLTCSISLIKS